MTSAAPTAWPHCELPAPRGRIGMPSSAAIGDRRAGGFFAAGQHDADRLDLVDRGIGRVAAAAGGVEQHLAVDLLAQPRGK